MTFAFAHAWLGFGLALLACLALRRRSASARCWAWRVGLLKGPLALLGAVPVVVASSVAEAPPPPIPETSYRSYRTDGFYKTDKEPADPLPWVYAAGVAAVLLARLAAARRPRRAMPRVEGVFRPRVVVPDGLAPQDAAMALAHERAHVRRRDPQWSLVADLCCAALWFAPGVWLCARAMRMESEAACDAEAMRETGAARGEYARLLLAIAGPAPANALGGPARRLARRIVMLNQNPKPLPRPAWALLALVGLAAVLPWQATAAPLQATGSPGVMPFRIPLGRAVESVFLQPGVKAKIGWTKEQEAALVARAERWQKEWSKYQIQSAEVQRTKSLKEWNHFEYLYRDRAGKRADAAAGPPVWTPAQEARLKSLALARFGGAVWSDDEVANRLGLSEKQRQGILLADMQVINKVSAAIPKSPKYPPKVLDLVRWTTAKYFAAAPQDRPALLKKLNALTAPYQKTPPLTKIEERRRFTNADAWKARAVADRSLEAALTPNQRKILDDLKTDPSSWERSFTYYSKGSGLSIQGIKMDPNPGKLKADAVERGLVYINGTRYTIWRKAGGPGKADDYSIHVGPKPSKRP